MIEGAEIEKLKQQRVFYGKNGQLERAMDLLLKGYSVRELERRLGIAKNTLYKYKKYLEIKIGGPILCRCGKPSNHRGWCSSRFYRSPSRLLFMEKLNKNFNIDDKKIMWRKGVYFTIELAVDDFIFPLGTRFRSCKRGGEN